MATLITDRLGHGSSNWIIFGIGIGVCLLLLAAGLVFGSWNFALPGTLTLSRDSFETWVAIGLGALIAALLIFAGIMRIRLGRQDVRHGIAKRFHGPITIERSITTSNSVDRTTYAVLFMGTKLVRARSDIADPLFASHPPTKSWNPFTSTETARVTFTGSVDFAPRSQFIFRLTDDPEPPLIDPPSA